MASPTQTIRLSPDLQEICRTRARQLGYKDASAYMRSLIRYDAMVQGSHAVTLPIAEQSLEAQDRIDAKLLQNVIHGISERGEFLRHLLEGMEQPTAEKIVQEITKK